MDLGARAMLVAAFSWMAALEGLIFLRGRAHRWWSLVSSVIWLMALGVVLMA